MVEKMLMSKKETRLLVENWRNIINEDRNISISDDDLSKMDLSNEIEDLENIEKIIAKMFEKIISESYISNINLLNESFMDKIKDKTLKALLLITLGGAFLVNNNIDKDINNSDEIVDIVGAKQNSLEAFQKKYENTFQEIKNSNSLKDKKTIIQKHNIFKKIIDAGAENFNEKKIEEYFKNSGIEDKKAEKVFKDYLLALTHFNKLGIKYYK